MRLTVLLLALQVCASGQTPAARIQALDDAGGPKNGFWGVHAVDLATGTVIAHRNADRPFIPASTAKLFSAALALDRLGADYRFVTTVTSDRAPDAGGQVAGDVTLRGGGDPTISARPLPFGSKAATTDPLQGIEELADQIVARGVRRIDGDIVGDDTAYPWEPYPEGRAEEDALWDYGAPVSALSINENRVALTIRPGRKAGEPARIQMTPALDYYIVDNRVRTASGGVARIAIERRRGSRQVRVWGTLPAGGAPTSRLLAIEDPAEYAAAALADALSRRGVAITGRAIARHRYVNQEVQPAAGGGRPAAGTVELARRTSPPLAEILEVTVKESLNLHAELILHEVGRVQGRGGSRRGGLDELAKFAGEAGVAAGECALVDGSGLSMADLLTPRAITALLVHMNRSGLRDLWMKLLAAPGEDGTLRRRLAGAPEGSVRAKTGSMNRINSLAGYARTREGKTLAFAVMVNQHTAPASEIRALIDKIVLLLVRGGS
jgi:D-alanyl-D-alanine carboxypeptidase/D-alanyl-D-alanine-endopeptidase (penicillin-binding protein 4)